MCPLVPESSPNGEIRWTHQHRELILPPHLPLYIWWQFYLPSDPRPVWPWLWTHIWQCALTDSCLLGKNKSKMSGGGLRPRALELCVVTDCGSKPLLLFRCCASLFLGIWNLLRQDLMEREKGREQGVRWLNGRWMEGIREAWLLKDFQEEIKKEDSYYGTVINNSYCIS